VSDNSMDDKRSDEEESFSDLLDSYNTAVNQDVRVGDRIRGKIISISKDAVFVDTGFKTDGIVDKEELLDDNMEMPYKEGDTLELYVVSYNENEIRLSNALSGGGGFHVIEEAFESSIPVEGKVKGVCKGGFDVEVLQKRAFCPLSQIDLKYVEIPEDYVGETYLFLITQFEEDPANIVVSRRELLKREQGKARRQFLQDIDVGSQLNGKVTKLMPYGAFVELFPGIEGMVHLSEISWSRVEKAEEVLSAGDSITVRVISIEGGREPGQMKIALSIKQVTEDPWISVQDRLSLGDKVRGKITRCEKFGAFVEIEPGIEGLVHISEMSYRRVVKPEDIVEIGEYVDVMIKEIDLGKRRISLSMKDAEGDPWIDVLEKYRVGQTIEGKIERKEKFGFFVELEPGMTGLLPRSKLDHFHKPALIEKLREGDAIMVVVEDVHPHERKITLGPGDSMKEDDWRDYTKNSGQSLGSLGDKLIQALKSKKRRHNQIE
jgi:small subunit ribosomal protein S1